jgi:hypothetical protein
VPATEALGDWAVEAEYTGGPTVSPRGTERPAGDPVAFGYERFDPFGAWDLRFHRWEPGTIELEQEEAVERLLAGEPFMTRTESRLDYQWFTPRIEGVPREGWAVEATSAVDLDPGAYSLRTITDGRVRVWIDGRLVIDRWEPHGAEVAYAPIAPGRHEVRVLYVQPAGWTEVRVDVVRGDARSAGSPGPH